MPVRTGLDVWVADRFSVLRGQTVGAIVNPTTVDSEFRHLVDLLGSARGIKLKAIFGPEHGVRGNAQYMEPVDGSGTDARGGARIFSLYGRTVESLSPKREWLEGLDALVFDIQDVGSRYYTYVATMGLAMKAAAKAKLPFFVLDRPNPIGGSQLEGNLVGEKFRSFVGMYPVPNRHGMTAGELARFINAEQKLGCNLSVVRCQGWSREHYWNGTGLSFIPPSPNMPTPDTALVYPGMCLLEGTNLSEGRGTCRPFEQFGAPWLDPQALIDRLLPLGLLGVKLRPTYFTPSFDKHQGVLCAGAMLHVVDRRLFQPLRTAIAVVQAAHDLGGEHFGWRKDAYEFVKEIPAFDLLCGTDQVRKGIEAGWTLKRLLEGFEQQLAQFRSIRTQYLLYG